MKCGLLGQTLGHSFSPAIHSEFGGYDYVLYEKTEDELEDFIINGDWDGLNVTIPYKKTVFKYANEVSETAKKVGSVNTLVKKNGRIYADNTDVFGFTSLVKKSGIDISGMKVLVLGSGGASVAVCYALSCMNANPIVISRSGENNYSNIDIHKDADIIVNTTPVGMYPHNGEAPLSLSVFDSPKAVFDIVYNPLKTALLLEAESLDIPAFNGLYMLTEQARKSSSLFKGEEVSEDLGNKVYEDLLLKVTNIVLVGMPGSGKSTVGRELAAITGREFTDSDDEITKAVGRMPSEIIKEDGEEAFRNVETDVLNGIGKKSGIVFSTGGGCVTKERNYALLKQNGVIVWLLRDEKLLVTEDRPLSQGNLKELAKKREPFYDRFADITEANDDLPVVVAQRIVRKLKEISQ